LKNINEREESMNIQNKETAIQDEQQLKSKQEIINNIIEVLATNVAFYHTKYYPNNIT